MGRRSFHRFLRRLLACHALAAGLCARDSLAEDDGPVVECPSLADVVAELEQVLSAKVADAAAGEIALRDQGETWDIEVRGRASTYSDPARDCSERARVAAVFAALVIEPLDADPASAKSPTPPPPAPPPPLASVAAPAVPPARPPEESERRWQIGVQAAFDRFSGGRTLSGGDLFVAAPLGRWFVAELRVGGRLGADDQLPAGQLITRAATAAAAVGLNLIPGGRRIGAGVLARIQGYWVRFEADQAGERPVQTAVLDAWTLAAEPRLTVVLVRHLSLEASLGVGGALRPIVIREQGVETRSISGLVLSGSLGGVVWF